MKIALSILAMLLFGASTTRSSTIELQLDASRTNAPINPFIYGQFIEHLGRCIYGGIWAEMLEDRKFYFPITTEYAPYRSLADTAFPVIGASPWQIMGEPTSLTMVKEDAFVGEHSPKVSAGAGLRQRDLGVVADKNYEGYLWAKPLGRRADIEVTLVWGDSETERETRQLRFSGNRYSKQRFSFRPGKTTEKGAMLEIRVVNGDVLLGPPSLMPGDNVGGLRADTLTLLRQLDSPIYRWPGGNFVSGYDWRDGIGDRDRRPPRKNPAWTGVEHNDFGTDEFIAFCRELGTEPMIAVNTGFGDPHSAAQWVEYCNSTANTLAGSWRAKNAQRAPYNVKYWCVGNEMWGTFQLGWMQLHHYVIKHNLTADAMWKVDPTLTLVAVGDLETINREHDPEQVQRNVTWTHGMLLDSADHMSMISEHFYSGRRPWTQDRRVDVLTHVGLVREAIRGKAEGHRELQASLPQLKGRVIPIAMDEWNYWHREYVYGELGCIYELQDGLGIAAGLHEYYRHSDIITMAHYAQSVNVIGAIKTTRTAAEMETTGLVLQLYRAHYGQIPLQLEQEFAPCDVAAAITEDGRTLTVAVMNPSDTERDLQLNLTGFTASGTATRWHITGPSPTAHNTPGQPRVVDIERMDDVAIASDLRVPPLSVALFAIPVR